MGYNFQFHKLRLIEKRRWFLVLGAVAFTHLLFQSILLPYGNALRSLLLEDEFLQRHKNSFLSVHSTMKTSTFRNSLTVNASDSSNSSAFVAMVHDPMVGAEIGHQNVVKGKDDDIEIELVTGRRGSNDAFELRGGTYSHRGPPAKKVVNINEQLDMEIVKFSKNSLMLDKASENRNVFPLDHILVPKDGSSINNGLVVNKDLMQKESHIVETGLQSPLYTSPTAGSSTNMTHLENLASNANSSVGSSSHESGFLTSVNVAPNMTSSGKKKMRCELPPKSITLIHEMNRKLMRHSRSMRPRWSSKLDLEILDARLQIEHAPAMLNEKGLYAPIFRNVTMFKRSYELMEQKLRIYVYRDGNKPIFHQPILKGLYASEGWFMKLMEGNKRFLVRDPRKAHLFYMPFSSRMLEYTLYVRNSHNRTNLRLYLKDYSEKIAAKYPYWNRTGGADHFLVACHDWAPYETRHHMERCIKALCNADVTAGFKIGRDVSLPETYVRSARNPQKDLGGRPPSERHILAFYAGNMHGYLRPILLKHWKDKGSDMKIFGPMPPGVASKMNYIHHMKSSKYCICPKGYEVNSPRVVEAIFYECVPVIISDNFVPPFFEVLNWDAFAVVLAEKDIPNLKDILLSIPEEKYLDMQLGVRMVQKHFLWHAKPMKYDLFHMTLHSIWYNRVFQIKLR
ncbi:Exostosin family protein [Quillaja saponaria]|uniref:Exostosin family protein n=1 Tax=Quillaja saponaria TaxID=32244 RepID=A0AAD7VFL2_QUISA|nr:Exostosin family protein [Quillaja saponaria]